MSCLRRFGAAALLLVGMLTALVSTALPAHAAPGQLGQPQIVLNPGGGQLADGSDGLRFTLNSDYLFPLDATPGQDAQFYRGTRQFCCSASAPQLNVGGTLFGQAGPASGAANWTSLSIIATSGSAAVGPMTSATGDATALVRYVAVKNGLEYVVDRRVSYTYPNGYVTDTYTFTIPEGNTEQVKFYLGGDTAPGGSDAGVGVMMSSPVRSIYSVNPISGIQVGFREVPGSKPFDGATSQSFYTPYAAVVAGQDIGFHVTPGPGIHDAGLMMQWNLGSTPGTQTASLQQGASLRGTNLTAGFDTEIAQLSTPLRINASIENTLGTGQSGLGFNLNLPPGVTIATGAQTNSCGGTLNAPVGGSGITVTGAAVGVEANCVISVPVVVHDLGTYTLTRDDVTVTGVLGNEVGTTSFYVPIAPEIQTDDLGSMTVGEPVGVTVAAIGAPVPTFAITDGALPAGLQFNVETGQITGTPTVSGPWSVEITASNAGGSASTTYSGTVARGVPGLGVQVTPSLTSYGNQSTVEATALPSGATGTVTFSSGGETLCSATLPDSTCLTSEDLLPGMRLVTAAYSGDGNWEPRTIANAATFIVTSAPVSVSTSLSTSTTPFRTPVTVTAEVAPATQGTVIVSVGGNPLCVITLPETSCVTTEDLGVGEHTITAAYSGDLPRYESAIVTVGTLTVTRATPSPTALQADSTFAESATLAWPDLPADATGTVDFELDGVLLCSYDLADSSCPSPTGLPAGTHDVVVSYSGDDNYEPVMTSLEWQIDPASTDLSTPPTLEGTYGGAVTVPTSGVLAGAGGTIEISRGDGTVLCSTAAAPGVSCALPADLPAGTHSLLVSYSGDANHLGSASVSVVTIARAPITLTTLDPVETGRNIAAQVDVGGVPADATGVVAIVHADDAVECSYDVTEASGCETSGLAPGTWTMAAAYSGDANHLPARQEFALIVDRDASAIRGPAAVAGVYGVPTLFEISGLAGDATGEVLVRHQVNGSVVTLCGFTVPAASSCQLPGTLTPGSHDLTVDYVGDANHHPSTDSATLTVSKAPVSLVAANVSVVEGSDGDILIAGLPRGATGLVEVLADGTLLCSFEASEADSCRGGASLTLGEHPLLISYAGDGNHESAEAEGQIAVLSAEAAVIPVVGAFVPRLAVPFGIVLVVFGGTIMVLRRRLTGIRPQVGTPSGRAA